MTVRCHGKETILRTKFLWFTAFLISYNCDVLKQGVSLHLGILLVKCGVSFLLGKQSLKMGASFKS